MTKISTLFWDVGGVLLTNGWDHEIRNRAAQQFDLNWDEFRERHDLIFHAFETGRVTLDSYLDCTVFYRERDFLRDDFKAFMFNGSEVLPGGALEILRQLAQSGSYLMAALNNEALELNFYRIEQFHLRDYFSFFASSCVVGLRKPEAAIYRLALNLSQRSPSECVFIDDRALNVERAAELGINAIQFQSSEQLIADLAALGVTI